jgi:hypothetical protein
MGTALWIVCWTALVVVIAAAWMRERRKGNGAVSYDTYASKGVAESEARSRAELRAPNKQW